MTWRSGSRIKESTRLGLRREAGIPARRSPRCEFDQSYKRQHHNDIARQFVAVIDQYVQLIGHAIVDPNYHAMGKHVTASTARLIAATNAEAMANFVFA